MIPAIEQSFFQAEIAEASFRFRARWSAGSVESSASTPTRRMPPPSSRSCASTPSSSGARSSAWDELRERRDAAGAEAALARLEQEARQDGVNLMPAIVDAAKADVTMGEMCDVLRRVWGTWRESPVF